MGGGDTSHTQKPLACQHHEGARAKMPEGNQARGRPSSRSIQEMSLLGGQVLRTLPSISKPTSYTREPQDSAVSLPHSPGNQDECETPSNKATGHPCTSHRHLGGFAGGHWEAEESFSSRDFKVTLPSPFGSFGYLSYSLNHKSFSKLDVLSPSLNIILSLSCLFWIMQNHKIWNQKMWARLLALSLSVCVMGSDLISLNFYLLL